VLFTDDAVLELPSTTFPVGGKLVVVWGTIWSLNSLLDGIIEAHLEACGTTLPLLNEPRVIGGCNLEPGSLIGSKTGPFGGYVPHLKEGITNGLGLGPDQTGELLDELRSGSH
jgi:hypothetical protein